MTVLLSAVVRLRQNFNASWTNNYAFFQPWRTDCFCSQELENIVEELELSFEFKLGIYG